MPGREKIKLMYFMMANPRLRWCTLFFVSLFFFFHIETALAQYRISGQVEDSDGLSRPSVMVRIEPTGQEVISDDDGRFSFEIVPAGDYRLIATDAWLYAEVELHVQHDIDDIIVTISPELNLDAVVISSIRFGAEDKPGRTTLGGRRLEERVDTRDLPYALQHTPGVVVTSDAGAGVGYTAMRIRGSDQTRINVTVNGIPLNDAESQQVFFVDLPDLAADAESIDIQRGVGTSSNGASSFGASVHIETNRIYEDAGVTLTTTAGSFDTYRAGLAFHSGSMGNGFYLDGRVARITSDGYIDRASSTLSSIALSPAWVGEKTSLRYNLLYGHERTYQAWYGINRYQLDTDRTYNPAGQERPISPYPDQVDDYTQVHHQLHLNTELHPRFRLGLSLHYTPGRGYYEEYKADQSRTRYGYTPVTIGDTLIDATDLVRRRWLDNDYYGTVASLEWRPDDGQTWYLGGGWNRYDGRHFGEVVWATWAHGIAGDIPYYDNDAVKTDGHVYMKWQRRWGASVQSFVDLQYRRVHYSFEGPDHEGQLTDQSDELHFFNPKLGFSWAPNSAWAIHLQTGIAQKEPNRDDYTESTTGSRPRPERLWDTELGLTWRGIRGAMVQTTAYCMYYHDQLALTGAINDVGAVTRINVDRSYRYGIEVAAQVYDEWPVDLDASLAWSQNRILSPTLHFDQYDEAFNYLGQVSQILEDGALPFSPEWVGHVMLSRQMPINVTWSWKPFIRSKWVSSQFIDLSSDKANRLDAYHLWDAGLTMTMKSKNKTNLSLRAQVHNLFNEAYASNAWSYGYYIGDQKFYDQGFFPQALRHWDVTLVLGI